MRVIDLFAGAGGFSRGFKEAGFEIVAAVENFPPKAKSYQANFPEAMVFVEDIKRLNAEGLKREVGEVEVLIGGPPCEPFTAINLRRRKDPLDRLYSDPVGRLVLHFVRFLKAFKPEIFVMEEVPQIMEGPLRKALQKEFKKAGYEVYFNLLDAYDYATPQIRKRVFISNIPLNPPKAEKKLTVWDAIGDLPDPRVSEGVPNHEYVPISAKKRRAISKLRWGEALHSFGGRFKNWIRLHPHKPAPTVRGTSRFVHPFEDRLLTVREHARLMGYPDYHIFLGGRNVQYDSVGESVPPTVARAIAEVIKERLKKNP